MDWWKQLWKSEGPLKAKINLWQTLNNKLLRWDNLQKRGWIGRNRCALCYSDEEIVSHLFNLCSYAEFVWKAAYTELKYQGTPGASLEHKAKAWWIERSVCLYNAFPSLFSYGIWWARNTIIFNNKMIPPEIKSALVTQWVREHRSQEKIQKSECWVLQR